MNYIEAMMQTAGCKRQYCGWLDMGDLDTNYQMVRCDTLEEWQEECEFSRTSYSCNEDNKDWQKPELLYPDFSVEKQLEIIKLIMKTGNLTFSDAKIPIPSRKNKPISIWCNDGVAYSDYFTQALAQLTTELMNADELDKTKVKEILENARYRTNNNE